MSGDTSANDYITRVAEQFDHKLKSLRKNYEKLTDNIDSSHEEAVSFVDELEKSGVDVGILANSLDSLGQDLEYYSSNLETLFSLCQKAFESQDTTPSEFKFEQESIEEKSNDIDLGIKEDVALIEVLEKSGVEVKGLSRAFDSLIHYLTGYNNIFLGLVDLCK